MAGETNYSTIHYTLKNGVNMPAVGLGTSGMKNYTAIVSTLDYALESGYRLFDTSAVYGNEKLLKKAFSELLPKHGLLRENLFITTKIAPVANDTKLVYRTFERSLHNLGLEYIDLYMLQYPSTPHTDPRSSKNAIMRANTWLALTKLYDQSKAKAIGVSNFDIRHLMQLSELKAVGPMVNQIEFHPYYHNPEMLLYCNENNIRLQAHTSFGGLSQKDTTLIKDPVVKKIARRYQAGAEQILLLWALQKGVAVIPKSNNPEHLRDNMQLNFRISNDDMLLLDALGSKKQKYAWNPTAMY